MAGSWLVGLLPQMRATTTSLKYTDSKDFSGSHQVPAKLRSFGRAAAVATSGKRLRVTQEVGSICDAGLAKLGAPFVGARANRPAPDNEHLQEGPG